MQVQNRNVDILIVDDDVVCQMLAVRAFGDLKSTARIVTAEDGVEALEILRGRHQEKSVDENCVILLDLRMPRKNGLEFLAELRKDASLRNRSVFVLTTSNQLEDVEQAYDHNAAGYFVKPIDFGPLMRMMTMIDSYCQLVTFPPSHADEHSDRRDCRVSVA